MKKIIGAIAIIALAVIVGIGAGYYFTHQNSGSPQNASTTSSTATISEAEAQQIALEDAGLAEADVSFTKQNSTATTAASNMRSNLSPVLTTPSTIMRSTHRAAPSFPLIVSRGATAMHSRTPPPARRLLMRSPLTKPKRSRCSTRCHRSRCALRRY